MGTARWPCPPTLNEMAAKRGGMVAHLNTFDCTFTFYNCIVPMGFLPCEIWVVFPGESQLQRYSAYGACFSVSIIPPNSDMDYRIFNVNTDVTAYDCTRGCTDTRKRVCTESWLWEKKPSRTGESNLRPQRASPMLYRLSYILTVLVVAVLRCMERSALSRRAPLPLLHSNVHTSFRSDHLLLIGGMDDVLSLTSAFKWM